MTRRCKHDWTYKPDYPEDIICERCQTIKKVASLTRHQFIKLPMDIRRWILNNQAKELMRHEPKVTILDMEHVETMWRSGSLSVK